MNRELPCRPLVAAAILAQGLAASENALAWDSVSEARAPTMPHQVWPLTFPRWAGDQRQFYMQSLKDAIGGMATGYGDVTTKLLRCPADAVVSGDSGIARCSIATQQELEAAQGQWLTSRVAGAIEQRSEHTLLAREAARRAGLLRNAAASTGPEIFEPFWVRYPAHDKFIASAIDDGSSPPAAYVVGQSQRPLELGTPGASFVARPIALLELAQLPDSSHSLSDWAMGNESCPIPGTERAYADIYPTEACHSFQAVMGAVNVTHFAPLNRDMWRHYHRLALAKMSECNAYQPVRASYQGWPGNEVIPDSETEVHECERFAMAYEMFAQHFLQDAWSSGHMWSGWGKARFTEIPANVELYPNEARPEFSPLSEPGRRAMVGASLGIARGVIHGAKALTSKLAERPPFRAANDSLIRLGFFDDPLNGGTYRTFSWSDMSWVEHDVEWVDPIGLGSHAGAGDLFWDPRIRTGAVVSQQARYEIQRERLLNCSARSMLDVYQAGPRASGESTAGSSALASVSPDSEQCWGQWATNASMLSALGALDGKYIPQVGFALGTMLRVANSLTVGRFGVAYVAFPEGAEFVIERAKMIARVGIAFEKDMLSIEQAYLHNAEERANGTESAQGRKVDDSETAKPLSLLGVGPAESGLASDPPLGVDYVDRAPVLADTTENATALSRMFWRGNLRRTCELEGLGALQQACVAATQQGGNAEVCTACVAQAELHVPGCSAQSLGPSKCSAAQAETGRSGAPSWWFDYEARVRNPSSLPPPFDASDRIQCDSSMRMALQWCTGTPNAASGLDGNLVSWRRSFVVTDTDSCGDPLSPDIVWGTAELRGARFLLETSRDARPWIYPMAVGYDYSVSTFPGEDRCDLVDQFTTSRDPIIDHAVRPAFGSEYMSGYAAGAEVPRCGVTQLVYDYNRPCDDAREQLAFSLPDDMDPGFFYRATGASVAPLNINGEPNCLIRLPREVRTCPAGFRCTAGGECVRGAAVPSAPSFILLDPSERVGQ